MLALALSGLVVLTAHRLFVGVADGAGRLVMTQVSIDREANARRWLAAAFGSVVVGERGFAFHGEVERVEFGSWQYASGGWLVRRQVRLERNDSRLVATVGESDSIVLAKNVARVEFDYLAEPEQGEATPFVSGWSSPLSAPWAVRARIAVLSGSVDTLLLIVGPRG
jgi:hypothetical protein